MKESITGAKLFSSIFHNKPNSTIGCLVQKDRTGKELSIIAEAYESQSKRVKKLPEKVSYIINDQFLEFTLRKVNG